MTIFKRVATIARLANTTTILPVFIHLTTTLTYITTVLPRSIPSEVHSFLQYTRFLRGVRVSYITHIIWMVLVVLRHFFPLHLQGVWGLHFRAVWGFYPIRRFYPPSGDTIVFSRCQVRSTSCDRDYTLPYSMVQWCHQFLPPGSVS